MNAATVRNYGQMAFFAVVVGFLLLASQQLYRHFASKRDLPPFVFVEVRAVDPSGHPVAGAKVRLGNADQGLTDSFGEWRRFLRLELGSQLMISVSKQSNQGHLFAAKNVTVPATPPRQGEAEIKANIQLAYRTKGKGLAPAATDVAPQLPPNVGMAAPAGGPPVSAQGSVAAMPVTQPAVSQAPSGSLPQAPAATMAKVQSPSREMPRVEWPTTISIRADEALPQTGLAAIIATKVVPALQDMFKAEGLTVVDSGELSLKLGYIPLPDGTGLVRSELSWLKDGRRAESSFLRNFGKTVNETARVQMALLKSHIGADYQVVAEQDQWVVRTPPPTLKFWQPEAGTTLLNAGLAPFRIMPDTPAPDGSLRFKLATGDGVPCGGSEYGKRCLMRQATLRDVPPVAGWTHLVLRATGQVTQSLKIYVSGYEARRLAPTEWEFWGEAKGPANITAIDQNHLVLRTRVNAGNGPYTAIAIPSSTVARK